MNNMNKELEKTTRFEFGSPSSECEISKRFGVVAENLNAAKTAKYDKAIAMSDIFTYVLDTKEGSPSEMFEYVSEAIGYEAEVTDSDEFDSESENLKLEALKLSRQLKRYCEAEISRKRNNYADIAPIMELEVGDLYVMDYVPQRLCVEKNPVTGTIRIEAIRYKLKKAPSGKNDGADLLDEIRAYDEQVSKAGGDVDRQDQERLKNVNKWIDEYLGLKYIQRIIEEPEFQVIVNIQPGDRIEALGSVYYMEMKSNDDKIADFFDGRSNVFYLAESYIVGTPNQASTELDDIFKDYAVKHKVGKKSTQCSKDDCKYCKMFASCGFQKANVALEEVEVTSNAKGDYTPTQEQQAIIDAALELI